MSGRTVHPLGAAGVIKDWLVSPIWRASCADDLATLLPAAGSPWGDGGRWALTQGPEVAPLKERLYRRRPLVLDQALPPLLEGGPVSWTAPAVRVRSARLEDPHAMLSSVQDYRPGLPGLQEHVWGATLAPEAQVFATYPGCAGDSPSARPNSWAGQRVLPRARQDRDSVLVVYPDATELATHVWFPVPHLDSHTVRGPWLAGRVGRGYAAVACAGGLTPVTAGDTAGQEWLPSGNGTAFTATVGCAGPGWVARELRPGTARGGVRCRRRRVEGRGRAAPGAARTARVHRGRRRAGHRHGGRAGDGRPPGQSRLPRRVRRGHAGSQSRRHRMVLDIAGARRAGT